MTDSPQTDAAPSDDDSPSKPGDRLLEHSYDGIQEFDNPMPGWWKTTFWLCCVFAALYFFHFQMTSSGKGVHEVYKADVEVASAEEAKRAAAEKVSEESLTKLAKNEGMVLSGRAIFEQRCTPCHDQKAQGKIGPNLTDNYWIHGKGQLLDIYQVVHDGVPAKGMISWGKILKPIELRQVVTYVGSVRGTNVPGKPPEGNPVK